MHALREVSIQKVVVFVHKTTHTVSHLEEGKTIKKRQILPSNQTSTKFRVQVSLFFSFFSPAMSTDDVPGAVEKWGSERVRAARARKETCEVRFPLLARAAFTCVPFFLALVPQAM